MRAPAPEQAPHWAPGLHSHLPPGLAARQPGQTPPTSGHGGALQMGGEDAEVRKLGVDAAVRRAACRPRCARAHIRTHPAMADGACQLNVLCGAWRCSRRLRWVVGTWSPRFGCAVCVMTIRAHSARSRIVTRCRRVAVRLDRDRRGGHRCGLRDSGAAGEYSHPPKTVSVLCTRLSEH